MALTGTQLGAPVRQVAMQAIIEEAKSIADRVESIAEQLNERLRCISRTETPIGDKKGEDRSYPPVLHEIHSILCRIETATSVLCDVQDRLEV